jgi:ribosomal protein L37AE/L43A
MQELLEKFEKTHACPKCENSYFTLNVNWMSTYIKTVYTCESCNWSFIKMSSCTSPSNVQDLSLSNRSTTSVPQTQST